MRKQFLALALAATALACNAQKKSETVEGNGNITTRDVAVSSFDQLQASGVYELRLVQGSTESVKIEADENLQQYLQVSNEGSKLVISMDKLKNRNMKTKKGIKVFVSFKNLKSMDLSMVGNVLSEKQLSFNELKLENKSVGNLDLDMKLKKLDLENESVGNVKISGSSDEVKITNESVGNIRAGDFLVKTMKIDNSGVGNTEVNASEELKVRDNAIGKVSNRGNATVQKIKKTRV